ncbi:class I adenylate-forming enzyme family protein [Mycobacterium sp. EPa45]|uniref:class I adenylate-forming enzyme family protein n=1 Tax=Mycobacterium sp. EPa45 TaxID=1545728 RepID=UPI0006419A73|nr:class I adenylate-forming enzyme family protein [Mycobacterium sp. EPa45]AKK27218.1 AMP-dependent synthetase [Mycobacterium sp. EPa45]
MADVRWGSDIDASGYAGHRGLQYSPRPSTFADLFAESKRWADRTFLVHGERRMTFAAFSTAVNTGVAALRDAGVQPGDRVMLYTYNSPQWVIALWSAWRSGAVPVLANRWWKHTEVDHAITLLEPRLILTDTALDGVDPRKARDIGSLAADGPVSPAGFYESDDPDATSAILFTSGSSGLPKAVELSRRAVIANQHNILAVTRRLPHQLDLAAPQTVSLASTPMFHVGGLSNLLTNYLTGGRVVIPEGRFDAGQILGLIEREGVHNWGGVPTMAIRVLEHPDFDSFDLSSLRSFPLGGAAVPTALLDRLRVRLPHLASRGLANTWGMTEAGGFLTAATGRDLEKYPGTVGRPYPVVELSIDRPDADGVGEILARAPSVMNGYVGIDDGTVDDEGWLHTGDLGHLVDGYLFIDGRAKDIVIRGGENIGCGQVEAALSSHPAVVEVAAVGLPHPDLGEELAAVIVHRQGDPAPTVDELRSHVSDTLAHFAIPTRWHISTTALPTLPGEKVDKKSLAERFDDA